MIENILNINGIKPLNKNQQKQIKGGSFFSRACGVGGQYSSKNECELTCGGTCYPGIEASCWACVGQHQ